MGYTGIPSVPIRNFSKSTNLRSQPPCRRLHSPVLSPISMEYTGIYFSSLTVHEDEISTEEYEISSSSEEEDLYSSSEEEEDEEEEEEEEVVRSPAHPYDLDSLPKSVLLDVRAYFDDRTNATTAYAPLLKKHRIQLTLWTAHPPRVSFLTVHSSGVDAKEFTRMPMVVASQDDLVLLRVTIGPHDRLGPSRYVNHYYVYKAGVEPSLTLLPDASSFVIADHSAGILCLGDGSFIIAAIQWSGTHGQYDLHQFDSKTSSWTTRLMHVDKPDSFTRILTSKVLVIGGKRGLVAWVDLWNGILFCEVLTDNTVLRYGPLPPALNKKCTGPPEYVRDIAIIQGCIKFFEMRLKVKHRQVAYNTTLTSKVLVATTWKMMDPWQEWQKDCVLDIFKIPVDKNYSALLPNLLRSRQGTQIALEGLEVGLPALSLHEDGVVYIMAKTKEMNRRAIVLAVNMRKRVLQGVAKFDAKRTYGFSYTYLQSGISNYLSFKSSLRYKGMEQISQLLKYGRTAADSSSCPVAQAGDMYTGNAVDSSRRPVTQQGDMYKGIAADSGWVQISKAPNQKAALYEGNAVDSSRRPVTQAGDIYKGKAVDSSRPAVTQAGGMYRRNAAQFVWVPVSRTLKQKSAMYKGNAVDSSRRPVTQAGETCKGNAARSVWVPISRAREQRV